MAVRGGVSHSVRLHLDRLAQREPLYYELHLREDRRIRTFAFVQGSILVLLAVFTPEAGGNGGALLALDTPTF